VVVGLSGGSDSVALLLLLRELSRHGGFSLLGVAHLNHQLRETAGRDETFCRDLADRLGLRVLIEEIDVLRYARAQGLSIEDAARRNRYEFLSRSADAMGADTIAVGHTQDDQAETFLLKVARGAGLTGLAGIYPRRGQVVRPLIESSRTELQSWLRAVGETWVEDESNADLGIARNRIRHVVLPELDRAAGGSTRGALARAAALAREDAQWLDELADEQYRLLVVAGPDGLEIDGPGVLRVPVVLRRRVLLRAMRQAGEQEVGLEHVEMGMAILTGTYGGADIPGARMELRRGKLVLRQQKVSK
jgi:tRNA(Ile)-lysidine synthase